MLIVQVGFRSRQTRDPISSYSVLSVFCVYICIEGIVNFLDFIAQCGGGALRWGFLTADSTNLLIPRSLPFRVVCAAERPAAAGQAICEHKYDSSCPPPCVIAPSHNCSSYRMSMRP